MKTILDVYFNQTLAGNLERENGILSFCYDTHYIKNKKNIAISQSMPLTHEPYSHSITEAFFQGLLPDAVIKTKIAKILQTHENNTFKLLEHLGADCAGAITVYPHKSKVPETENQEYKKISDNEAFEILTSLKRRPLYIGEDDFRVSGAGAQDKLVASVFDNTLHLPLNGTPSTHIIKPNIEGFYETTYNEFFCMQLAKSCGLNAPNTFIKTINNASFYVVERYDRIKVKNTWQRQHQEDFCQILGVLPEQKYESDGGPTLKDCFTLLDSIGVTGSDKIAFLDMVIFNYFIGNTDAHAKNFSIIYTEQGVKLAPCYDLLSTAIYVTHYPKCKMAMKLNKKNYLISKVNRSSFASIAEITSFKQDFILKRVDNIARQIEQKAKELRNSLDTIEKTNVSVYNKIIDIIEKHYFMISA